MFMNSLLVIPPSAATENMGHEQSPTRDSGAVRFRLSLKALIRPRYSLVGWRQYLPAGQGSQAVAGLPATAPDEYPQAPAVEVDTILPGPHAVTHCAQLALVPWPCWMP